MTTNQINWVNSQINARNATSNERNALTNEKSLEETIRHNQYEEKKSTALGIIGTLI